MKEVIDSSILVRYSLFDGFEQEQLDSVLPLMEFETFEAGTDIIVEGERADKLRFILEGRAAVLKGGIILMELDEGSVFGEIEVVDFLPAEATVKTLATTKTMSLSLDALGEIYATDLKTYSFIIMNLARDLSRRLRRMDSKTVKDSPAMDWN